MPTPTLDWLTFVFSISLNGSPLPVVAHGPGEVELGRLVTCATNSPGVVEREGMLPLEIFSKIGSKMDVHISKSVYKKIDK